MREALNRKSKIHPRLDGPFVAIASTEKDVYQLSTPNGYILQNLVNLDRLRKLSLPEIEQYTSEFWHASKRLKLYDRQAKEAQIPPIKPQANPHPVRITKTPAAPDPPARYPSRQRRPPTQYRS